jgi:integrase
VCGLAKKRIRVSKGTKGSQNHDIFGGKAQILRVPQSGEVWQFRMWIGEEKKYLRKSLQTRDFEAATDRAEKLYLETMANVSSGKKLFGLSLQELTNLYTDWRSGDVGTRITKGRLVTIKSQMKHILAYKGAGLKIGELERNSFYDYESWRKQTKPGTQSVTIRNEQSTINHMMDFAYREGYTHLPQLDFRPISIKRDEVGRRDIFALDEYDKLIRHLRSYVSKKQAPDETERTERLMVRDAILTASNSLLRVGELWQLRWGDVEKVEHAFDSEEIPVELVTLNVRGETSKTGNGRRIIVRGGQYFLRLRERSANTGKDDFVFVSVGGNKRLARQKWYYHWGNLMRGIGIEDYQSRKLTWYSLRHFGITCRIRAGNTYSEIAEMAGTSATYIETHYKHYDDGMLRTAALKSFSIDKSGIIFSE